jgi:hypothetical protein
MRYERFIPVQERKLKDYKHTTILQMVSYRWTAIHGDIHVMMRVMKQVILVIRSPDEKRCQLTFRINYNIQQSHFHHMTFQVSH